MRRDHYFPDGRFEHDRTLVRHAVTKLERSVTLLRADQRGGVGDYAVVLPQLDRLIKHLGDVNCTYERSVQRVICDRDALDAKTVERGAALKPLALQSRQSKRAAQKRLAEQEAKAGTRFMNASLLFAVGVTANTGIEQARGPERAFLHKFATTLANLAEANFLAYPRDIGDPQEPPTTAEVAREYFGRFAVTMNAIADSVAVDLVKASLATDDDSNVIQFRRREVRNRPEVPSPGGGPGGGVA